MKSSSWALFDRIGFSVSFICAVHCLAMPILLPLLPVLAGSFWLGESIESWIMILTITVAALALFRGYLLHRKFRVLFIFTLGIMFLFLKSDQCGLCSHGHWHLSGASVLHYGLAALGGFSLAIGHWLNLKFCKSCPACNRKNHHCGAS